MKRSPIQSKPDTSARASVRVYKPRKCAHCRELFTKTRGTQKVCSPGCAHELVVAEVQKADRRETRAKLEKLKTRSDWLKEAQVAFNKFIRARDRVAGHACISSGRPLDWTGNAVDAGHYRSTGAAPHLRFEEANCHAQSKHDNQYLAGNAVDYRINLIRRIGVAEVERLEADNEPRHYTTEQLIKMKRTYAARANELLKGLR